MSDEIKVRVGTPADVHDVMELALMGRAENGFVNADEGKILQTIWDALNLNGGIMGLVGPAGKKAQGAVLLRVITPWYSDSRVLEEQAIFIHPDYRQAKGGRASRLVEFSKHTAERLGMPLLIGVLSNSRTEAKVRLYERHLGAPAGAFFLFGAQTGGAELPDTSG
jgi:hypothetical protein